MSEAIEIRANVDAYLKEIGVTYNAEFVPQNLSRNSAKKDKSINWRVSFRNESTKQLVSTDYMQGIGHIPEVPKTAKGNNFEMEQARAAAAYRGIYYPKTMSQCWGMGKRIPAPPAADVLYCLLSDADAVDYAFEEWADNFGYNQDSREAERTYNACRDIGRQLRQVFTATEKAYIAELVREL